MSNGQGVVLAGMLSYMDMCPTVGNLLFVKFAV